MTDEPVAPPGAVTQWLLGGGRSDKQGLDQMLPVAYEFHRLVLVNHACDRVALKRGGQAQQVSLSLVESPSGGRPDVDLIALEDALERLAALDERKSRVVELKFFGGDSRPRRSPRCSRSPGPWSGIGRSHGPGSTTRSRKARRHERGPLGASPGAVPSGARARAGSASRVPVDIAVMANAANGCDIGGCELQGPVVPSTDLMASQTSDQATVKAGDLLTYLVRVRNLGPELAPNVVLTNVLSSGVTFVSASHAKGTHTAPPAGETGTVTWYLGDLLDQANETAGIKVTVRVKGKTTIDNTASGTADVIDINAANNTATLRVSVGAGGKIK